MIAQRVNLMRGLLLGVTRLSRPSTPDLMNALIGEAACIARFEHGAHWIHSKASSINEAYAKVIKAYGWTCHPNWLVIAYLLAVKVQVTRQGLDLRTLSLGRLGQRYNGPLDQL